jgi:dATP pyrophosphohydrolase
VPHKIPVSALVLVHTRDLRVLLIERADAPGYWQSVTGSQEPGESLAETAARELREETGIDAEAYGGVIDWQHSNVPRSSSGSWYAPVSRQTHVFASSFLAVRALDPREHLSHLWLPWQEAAAKCFSWSNRHAIELLGQRAKSEPRRPA